jgi:D-galactarolactone cycloisomerase
MAMIVEVETDNGLIGWGESQDPLRTDWIWQEIYARLRDHGEKGVVIEALSGIDIALWDIKGKRFGVPVSQLMGGSLRDSVLAYATGLYRRKSRNPIEYLASRLHRGGVQSSQAEGWLWDHGRCECHARCPAGGRTGQ